MKENSFPTGIDEEGMTKVSGRVGARHSVAFARPESISIPFKSIMDEEPRDKNREDRVQGAKKNPTLLTEKRIHRDDSEPKPISSQKVNGYVEPVVPICLKNFKKQKLKPLKGYVWGMLDHDLSTVYTRPL